MPRTIIHLRFYECEHHGDLNRYLEDLRSSGATVLDHRPDLEAEEAVVKIQVSDFPSFKTAFQKMDSADFTDSLEGLEVPRA